MHLFLNRKLKAILTSIVLFSLLVSYTVFIEIEFLYPFYIGLLMFLKLPTSKLYLAYIAVCLPYLIFAIAILLFYGLGTIISNKYLNDISLSYCIILVFVAVYSFLKKFSIKETLILLALPILQEFVYQTIKYFNTSQRPRFTFEYNLPIFYVLLSLYIIYVVRDIGINVKE